MTTYKSQEEAEAATKLESIKLIANSKTIEFNGWNCDEFDDNECDGWDGNDRRCECGNRRVSWEFLEYPKGAWTYYAEAY